MNRGQKVGATIVVLVLLAVVLAFVVHNGKKLTKDSRYQAKAEYYLATTTNLMAQLSKATNELAVLKTQLAEAKKAPAKMQEDTKQIIALRKQVDELKRAQTPNPMVMKALDNGASGDSAIVHMWTGEAATLHELKDDKQVNPQARGDISVNESVVDSRKAEAIQNLQERIDELSATIRDQEFNLGSARRNLEANTGSSPGEKALRRKKIREMEISLQEMDNRLAKMQAELQRILPAPSQIMRFSR